MSLQHHHFDQNSVKNIVRISALQSFTWSFVEAFWSFLWAFLLMILLNKSQGSPKKLPGSPPGSYKNFQGRNPYNIFVSILVKTMTPKKLFKIKWPLAVQISYFFPFIFSVNLVSLLGLLYQLHTSKLCKLKFVETC